MLNRFVFSGKIFFWVFVLVLNSFLVAADIGSDIAVNRFNTQVLLQDSDRVAGFAALQGGFSINNPVANAIFDSFFPVSGAIDFNFGTLTLNRDLIFKGITDFESLGVILGNDHIVELPAGEKKILPSNSNIPFCSVYELSSIATTDPTTCGQWSPDGKFVAVGFRVNEKIIIYERVDSSLIERDSYIFNRRVNDVSWHPTEKYRLAVVINRQNNNNKIWIFEVDNSGNITLESGAQLATNNHAEAVDWHYTGSWVAVGQEVSGSSVAIYAVNSSGIINGTPVATVNPGTTNRQTVRWLANEDYLAVGLDAAATNQLVIYSFNQVAPALTLEASLVLSTGVQALSWNTTTTYNVLAAGLEDAANPEEVRIYEFIPGSSIVQLASAEIGQGVFSLDWNNITGTCLAVGRDNGVANVEEFSVWSYDAINPSLTLIGEGGTADNQIDGVGWHDDYVFYLGDNVVYLYNRLVNAPNLRFDNLNLYLNSQCELESGLELHISGTCLINGGGNTLTLQKDSLIIVDSGSSILFKDISINNINNENIRCTDSTCTIFFENVQWLLSDNYTFTTGKFVVKKQDFHIIGNGYGFGYQTDQESSIYPNACLIFDENLTFSYAPISGNKNLIKMIDSTSELVLNGSTLYSTSTGIQLTKGKLIIERKSFISSNATTPIEAIIFGDGINKVNNINVSLQGAATLEIINGLVLDNNV